MAQPNDMVVFDNSHRASSAPSAMRKWADIALMGHATPLLRQAERSVGIGPVAAALHSVRASGEAAVMGGLLGLVSGFGMLEYKGAPVDLLAGIASIAGGVAFAHSEFGTTLRTCGHTAVGIFSFRKVESWMGVRKQTITVAGETDMGSDYGADPVMEAARSL